MDDVVDRKEELDERVYGHNQVHRMPFIDIYVKNEEIVMVLPIMKNESSWRDAAYTYLLPLLMLAVAVVAFVVPFSFIRRQFWTTTHK